ncbi:MAG: hypothetical protein VX127_12725 [Myxococcota bacterium]|nr:hypothetical protein [Myxococcota bacterium]
MRWLLLSIALLSGCKSDCIHMCQRIDGWLSECGYTWDATFEKEGWSSIDDCYDEHWESDQKAERGCKIQAADWDRRDCY